jgi:hypothetical protein
MFLAQQSQVSALMRILHDLALFCMLIPTIFVIVIYFEILDLKKKKQKNQNFVKNHSLFSDQ